MHPVAAGAACAAADIVTAAAVSAPVAAASVADAASASGAEEATAAAAGASSDADAPTAAAVAAGGSAAVATAAAADADGLATSAVAGGGAGKMVCDGGCSGYDPVLLGAPGRGPTEMHGAATRSKHSARTQGWKDSSSSKPREPAAGAPLPIKSAIAYLNQSVEVPQGRIFHLTLDN